MVSRYHNLFLRMLGSFFVQLPLLLWFKFLCWPLPQNKLDAKWLPIWQQSAQALAEKPFTLSAYGNAPHAADPRALAVAPAGVTVISCPDEPIANLVKLDPGWAKHKDPSGTILQLSGFEYITCAAFSLCGKHARVYAAASEIPMVLLYEFENIILQRLGYDLSQR